MIYPDKQKYPLGEVTTDGRRIAACYGAFFADEPAPSPPRFGFYFFRLEDEEGWYWQEFDFDTGRKGPIHGAFRLRRLACANAYKKRRAMAHGPRQRPWPPRERRVHA